jgi:hypothetical protein
MTTHRTSTGRARRLASVAAALVVAAAGGALGGANTAHAAFRVVVNYQMNEPAGSRVMNDSGPNNIDGTIGTLLTAGATYGGATGYRYPFSQPNQTPANRERLAVAPHNNALNPGASDYAIEFRYRTTRSFGNMVQKGQNKTAGGYFKFEQPKGFMTCLFKGGNGQQRAVKSPVATNDGQWHTIRCERTAWGVKLWVDGRLVKQLAGPTGTISNNKPLSIGGKYECNQTTITCDYFQGDIDYVKIEKG